MGDDLKFAQKFTRTAADGLAILAEMETPRAPHEASVVIDMMTTLQRGAKRLRARHIYSGAQGVLSALHHEDDITLDGRILSLGSLVTQYARGLDELLDTPESAPEKTPLDKWEHARETLNNLLPIASADDADILSRLMRAPVTLETVQPDQADISTSPDVGTDIIPFRTLPTAPINTAETANSIEASPVEVEALAPVITDTAPSPTLPIGSEPSIALDIVMRDVVADALSIARTVGRTISLSYDMGDRMVSDIRAVDIRTRLGQALSQIIRQSLAEGRVGHIDINLAGQQFHIIAGTTAVRVAIDPENVLKKPAPQAKRLITDETEQGLRAQLDALMDPIGFHGAAS